MSAPQPQFPVIHGYAVKANGEAFVPWQYTPRKLGPNDIEIKIDHCGICGSDIHTVDSGWGPTHYPIIVGHEIVGRVVTKGDSVKHLQLGDLVGVGAQAFACQKSDCRNCQNSMDAYCPHFVGTYNAKYADGQVSQGGYAEAVRVDSNYAFLIPKEIDPQEAAPLMCAGTTVFTPMLHHKMKKGDRVGVVGIGGLGHLAVQYAHALGAEVTAFTTSENKRQDAIKLGAHKVVNIRNEDDVKQARLSLDYLLVTTNSKHTDWTLLTTFMDTSGHIILLAVPEAPVNFNAFALIHQGISMSGSLIGGIEQVRETLAFAAKHNIRPWIEKLPMKDVNEGIERVRSNKVRFRVVLSN
ncbi:hypothetical protein IWQ62_003366 [Dispira parvispora]|uniref:Enoyl reductase (ER) domain-containing protein n=1 Tax=Dispira parvispora TaxID=1520584 RepID=A0A9W8ANL4_9FUNG|nr:hypothetical protein IWQ62_003366 [Dispira parvispora]